MQDQNSLTEFFAFKVISRDVIMLSDGSNADSENLDSDNDSCRSIVDAIVKRIKQQQTNVVPTQSAAVLNIVQKDVVR